MDLKYFLASLLFVIAAFQMALAKEDEDLDLMKSEVNQLLKEMVEEKQQSALVFVLYCCFRGNLVANLCIINTYF